MRLELRDILIKNIQFGDVSEIKNHTLYVNRQDIESLVMEDEHIKEVLIDIARPGEEVRITPVKDVIEPRVKIDSDTGMFPGVISKVRTVGTGKTNVLKGSAVVTSGRIVGFQEGIIDMTGEGAKYTPFSETNNLVLVCHCHDQIKAQDHEKSVRLAGIKVANFIGELSIGLEPDQVAVYETLPLLQNILKYPDLPKVAYVQMLQSQGLLHDTHVYGVDAKNIIPTILYPTELMDGAIMSGNCVSACDKNTTYHHQNNCVVHDLYKKHGTEINFVGVIITNENVYLADKERSSDWTAKLAEFLGVDGVIISQEGFGNPDTDLIMNCKKIEEKGIDTVIITDEYAGRDGASQPLADADEKANAVVTGGNANELVILKPMKKVMGHMEFIDKIAGGFNGNVAEDGTITIELQAIIGATNEIGFNKLSARDY
ncbi:MAG: Glycine reductase complex component B subunits alpha and beta [Clostridiales bacterium 38_11]|nr:MAG: Glycine reductase complex component B subunits alpha and beta [Clostridiales bacterium 38_11]HBH13224.1 beta-aspartyl-peptidase [Clostridiales bacterium]